MKYLFLFFALLSIEQTLAQRSFSYTVKKTVKTDFVCEVKLHRLTKTVESCIVSSLQKNEHQNDSVQTQMMKDLTQLKSMSEVLLFFSANKWTLLTSVSDCNSGATMLYYERTIIWESTEEKKRVTIPKSQKANEKH